MGLEERKKSKKKKKTSCLNARDDSSKMEPIGLSLITKINPNIIIKPTLEIEVSKMFMGMPILTKQITLGLLTSTTQISLSKWTLTLL